MSQHHSSSRRFFLKLSTATVVVVAAGGMESLFRETLASTAPVDPRKLLLDQIAELNNMISYNFCGGGSSLLASNPAFDRLRRKN